MLSKNGTISSTNWKNQHYFETSSALTLKVRTFLTTVLSLSVENGYSICDRSTMSSLMSTLIMTASHGDISVQGSLTAQKEHAHFSWSATWWSYRATHLVLQPLQMLQIYPLLSIEWIWTCGLAHHHHHVALCLLDFLGALNEHYLKFWALNRALNAEKTRDTQSTKSKFYEH